MTRIQQKAVPTVNITITVDPITLDTVVAEVYGEDEDGDTYKAGEKTVAVLVAEQIADRLVKDARWPGLRERVTQVRDEEIRSRVAPLIEAALSRPLRVTNSYGEATGKETTLSELISAEAQKQLTKSGDAYDRNRGSIVSQLIAAEVKKAFQDDIAGAVKQARDAVAKQIGATASSQITAAAMQALTSR